MAEDIVADFELSGIYQIRNLVNGKRYIGSAKCFRIRWNAHRMHLRRGSHHSMHLQASWKKHGEQVFAFQAIELCATEQLIAREQIWIDRVQPEFNVCPTAGSTLGRKFTEESKAKIAAKALGRKFAPRSDEYRSKLSRIHKGRKSLEHMAALQAGRAKQVYSADRRAKVGESLRQAYASGARARQKSEEHKNKIGQFYAKLSDEQVRSIRQLRSEGVTGRELAKRFGSNPGTVCGICKRKRYRWVS